MYLFAMCEYDYGWIWHDQITKPRKIMQLMRYRVLQEINWGMKRKEENERRRDHSQLCGGQFFGNWRGTSPETLMWDLDIESDRAAEVDEEWKLDRIIDLDEWSKFDQRGRSAILDDEEGQGPRSGKFFKNTRGSCRPRRPTPPTFFSDRFLYTSSFYGALGFFSYPLAGHLPLRKGRPRCRIYEEGLGQKRGRRMRTRWNGRR